MKSETKTSQYFEGVGRRKTAVARVRISKGSQTVSVNGQELGKVFPTARLQKSILAPIDELKLEDKFSVSAKVSGGGVKAQAEAVRLGIARALVKFDAELKKRLKSYGFMTRDPRMVERKKYGLKKARRAPQWAKR